MKKWILFLLFVMLLSSPVFAQSIDGGPIGGISEVPIRASSCTGYISSGKFCYNTTTDKLYIGNGTSTIEVASTSNSAILSSIHTFTDANWNDDDVTWTMTGTGPLVHVTGNTTSVTATTSEAIVAGTTYKVTITGTGGGDTASYTLGAVAGTMIAASGTIAITDWITASTSGALIITPASTCTVSISSVTVQKLEAATGDLTVDGNLTVHSPVTLDDSLTARDLITKGPWVDVRAYSTYSTDLGAVINTIMTANPTGVSIRLPKGKITCLTQINLDLMDTNANIEIYGQGTTSEPTSTVWGTIIDGSSMTSDVMVGGITKTKRNIVLRSFVIKGGTTNGLVIGSTSFSTEFSTIKNITVFSAGGWGIKIYNSYGSYLNQLYANQCGDGIYLYGMNASHIGILTSRENAGTTCPYAIDILGGSGFDIGTLYIESNAKGALRIGGAINSLTIGVIYTENNNTGNTGAYELLLGDYSVENNSSQAVKINNCFLATAAYNFTQAVIGISFITDLDLSFQNYWAPTTILKLVTNTKTNTPFILRNCESSTSLIDFSNANADGGIITIIGGTLQASVITLPSSVQVHTIGGMANSIGQLFDKSITAAGTTNVGVNDRNIYCNATLGAQTITLPDPSYADGLEFKVIKVDSTANTVAIVGTTYPIVGISSLTSQWDSAIYRYDFISAKCINLSTTSSATETAKGLIELATVTESIAGTDTFRAVTARGVASSIAVVDNPKFMSQTVHMTTSASIGGIVEVDNNNIDFGTNDFALVWKGSFREFLWDTPIMAKFTTWEGWLLDFSPSVGGYLNKIQLSHVNIAASGIIKYQSGEMPSPLNTIHEIVVTVVKDVGAVNGTVTFYVDGVILGSPVTITAGTIGPTTSSANMDVSGDWNFSSRTSTNTIHVYTLNFAPTSAEVLDLYRNSPPFSWKWATQTAQTSGTVTIGKQYQIDTFVAGDDFTNIGGVNTSGTRFVATGTTPTTWTNSSSLRPAGATLALEPEGIGPNKWIDSSTNQLDASYPTTGYSFTRPFYKELDLVDPDVTHGMSAIASTNSFGHIAPISGTIGGLDIYGLTDLTQDGALRLTGILGAANPTDTHAAIHLRGGIVSGTGWTDLAAAETVLRLSNHEAGLITVLGDGRVGFMTSVPDKSVEINLGTANAFRLTYNDSDGSAVNYADFTVSSTGSLTMTVAGTNPDIILSPSGAGAAKVGANTILTSATGQPLHASLTSIAGLTEVAGGMLWTSADNTYGVVAAGTAGQILVSNATSAPAFTSTLNLSTVILPNGTASPPTAEASIYWNSTNNVATVGDGSTYKTLAKLEDAQTWTAVQTVAIDSATTNTVLDLGIIQRTTTGTAGDGIGAALKFMVEDASGNVEEVGRIQALFPTAAHATQTGRMDILPFGATAGQGISVLKNADGTVFTGVGTATPGTKVEIKYGVQGALTLPLSINPGFFQTGTATGIGFLIDGTPSFTKGALVYTSKGTGWNIGDFQFLMRNDDSYNPVTLSDAVMTIKAGGNVGINTIIPRYKNTTIGVISSLLSDDGTNYEGLTITPSSGAVTFAAVTAGTGTDNIDITLTPAGTGVVKIGAATATSLLATGIVDGLTNIAINTGTTITVGGAGKLGGVYLNQHATPATAVAANLPVASAGQAHIIKNSHGAGGANTGVLTVHPVTSSYINYNGTNCTVSYNLVSGGAAGDQVSIVGVDATHWEVVGSRGTWTCTAP